MRPKPRDPAPVPTVWLDYTTGRGVDDAGRTVKPLLGGRSRTKPLLVDLLETAKYHQAARIMLTGPVPVTELGGDRKHWLITETPGWSPDGHWLAEPATGRFVHDETRRLDSKAGRVEVRLAREWFGDDPDLTPAEARRAWDYVKTILEQHCKGARMFNSPAATGLNIWAKALPKAWDGELLDDETAALIHATSGQHRQEHLAGRYLGGDRDDCRPLVTADEIPGFAYIDGRFMYAALLKERGTTPVRRLTGAQSAELAARTKPLPRARFKVRFTVPDFWDTLGILGVQHEDSAHWYYPNQPGATGVTWCDAAEAALAEKWLWRLEYLEGIEFTRSRVVDNFGTWMTTAYTAANTLEADDPTRARVRAAIRMILLQAIGSWHSRGRDTTHVVASANDIPRDLPQSRIHKYGDLLVYRTPAAPSAWTASTHHPELSAQVWALERTRILSTPIAGPDKSRVNVGALEVRPEALLGVNGDALYLTYVPRWTLPVEAGGDDDGRPGKLRLQGWLPGPMPTPATVGERNVLRGQAETVGIVDGIPDEVIEQK